MKKWLILIIIIGFWLRIYKIDQYPPALNWDEVSHGYNAFSVLSTGRDEWGARFPIIFRAYGDYKLPVYIYLTVISEAVLGINEIAVRMPSVIFGTALIIFTYLLSREIFVKKEERVIGVFAALLVAIEPWSLFLSRVALEANVAQCLFVGGAYYIIHGINKKSSGYIDGGLFLWGISAWTYNSERVFIPIILVLSFILFRKELLFIFKSNLQKIIGVLVVLILFGGMLLQLLSPEGGARYGWVSIINEGSIAEIVNARNECSFGSVICRIINNRPVYFGKHFIINYISYFNPSFLYLKGGSHYQFSVPDFGLLYVSGMGFLIIGLLNQITNINKKKMFILLWIIAAPIAGSLTKESPHVLRAITFLPIPMILTASGAVVLWNKISYKRKVFIYAIYGLFLFIQFSNYINKYSIDYSTKYGWSWQYGNKQMVNYVKANYENYENIIITKKYGEPHEFLLFYWPWKLEKLFIDPNLNRFNQSNWYWVDGFDKFKFINEWDVVKENNFTNKFTLESGDLVNCAEKSCLLVTNENNAPLGWMKIDQIYDLEGKIYYEIYKNL